MFQNKNPWPSLFLASLSFLFCTMSMASTLNVFSGSNNSLINSKVTGLLGNIPFFYAVPAHAYSDSTISFSDPSNGSNKDIILFQYVHPEGKILSSGKETLGLRLIIMNSANGRKANSKVLAQSRAIQTGDALLSYRPHWASTGAYQNLQMGISHAGMGFVKDSYAMNLEMPLNPEMMRDSRNKNQPSYISAPHYIHSKFVHILRPIISNEEIRRRYNTNVQRLENQLNIAQKSNLEQWSEAFSYGVGSPGRPGLAYPGSLAFESNYFAPSTKNLSNAEIVRSLYKMGRLGAAVYAQAMVKKGYDSSGNLAAYAKAKKPRGRQKRFCSDYYMSILGLRNCSVNQFLEQSEERSPGCAEQFFQPMPALGAVNSDPTRVQPGYLDGAAAILNTLDVNPESRDYQKKIDEIFFVESNPTDISSGHKTVAQLTKNLIPEIKKYLKVVRDKSQPNLANTYRREINAHKLMGENFPPTSFLASAMLHRNNPLRRFNYVGTLVYVSPAKFQKLKQAIR